MKTYIAIAMIFLITSWGSLARASQRDYIWTEEYGTLAKDNAELEFFSTAITKDKTTRSASDWDQQIEIEYGITDHLNVSLYQVYEQEADSSSLAYVGYNIELKYRIAEPNVLPLDLLLYAENEENTIEGNAFEGKLILSKDLGRLNVSYNQIYERAYRTGKGEHEYAAGVSYELVPWLRLAMESKGSYSEGEYAVGPTISWMGNRIWASIGGVIGLNKVTNDREVRLVLGFPF